MNLSPFRDACEAVGETMKGMWATVNLRVRYRDANPEIKRATQCSLCPKSLTEADTMFIDLFSDGDEDPKAHCEECENKAIEDPESTSLANNHHCYKINAKSKNFDILSFGPNEYTANEAKATPIKTRGHGCGCAARYSGDCKNQGEVKGLRWKCAHCPDFDFCNDCEIQWCGEPSESMVSGMSKRGHYDWHVMIRIA